MVSYEHISGLCIQVDDNTILTKRSTILPVNVVMSEFPHEFHFFHDISWNIFLLFEVKLFDSNNCTTIPANSKNMFENIFASYRIVFFTLLCDKWFHNPWILHS